MLIFPSGSWHEYIHAGCWFKTNVNNDFSNKLCNRLWLKNSGKLSNLTFKLTLFSFISTHLSIDTYWYWTIVRPYAMLVNRRIAASLPMYRASLSSTRKNNNLGNSLSVDEEVWLQRKHQRGTEISETEMCTPTKIWTEVFTWVIFWGEIHV